MICKQVREQLIDLATAPDKAPAEVTSHVAACGECAAQLKSMAATMALLDEWEAPEPSPYFDMRLRARVREEAATARTWAERLRDLFSPAGMMGRKAALATTMAVLLIGGMIMFRANHSTNTQNGMVASTTAPVGTAVGDLEVLGKNQDLYADFDLLDDVTGNNVNAGAVSVSE
jgi:hypothetical protein